MLDQAVDVGMAGEGLSWCVILRGSKTLSREEAKLTGGGTRETR